MDNFINLGKQFLESQTNKQQQGGQQEYGKTGGHEYNSPNNQGYNNQRNDRPQFDDNEVADRASREGSGDRSLFTSAMSFLNDNKDEHEKPLDEQHVLNAHDQAYNQGDASNMSARSMGSAAAMQILKKFTSSGSSSGSNNSGSGSGSQSQSQLISLAMAEASKLFDKSGGAASGNKQDAVNGAAMTVMKLLVQSKFSSTTGGSNSGGLSGLMGIANKFL